MFMRMLVRMGMVVTVVMRHGIIVVVTALAMFHRKFTEFAAITRHERGGCAALDRPPRAVPAPQKFRAQTRNTRLR